MGTSALNWHRAFLGAALLCRQLGGSGLSRNLCCPMSDAQFSGTFLASQAFWCWCCSPAKSIRVSCTSVGLDPGDGLCRWAALFPPFLLFSACHACSCSAALQAEAAVIFQHVLNRGVVGPTRQLRSLFHVFTCLGKVFTCLGKNRLLCWQPVGCTNCVRQNHEQVLVQPG